MASIDLTLNSIQIPAISGYTPPFGTKKASGGLTTQEVNDNVIAPFAKERPITITENSTSGNVEYNASIVLNSADVVFGLGSGTYNGCEVSVLALTTGSVSYTGSGGSTTDSFVAGQRAVYVWQGSAWKAQRDNVEVMTNKTIDSKDNKLLNTSTAISNGTTVNVNGDCFLSFSANYAAVTLGTAPNVGCTVTFIAPNYAGYVIFKINATDYKCVYMEAGPALKFICRNVAGYWQLAEGQELLVSNETVTYAPNIPGTSTPFTVSDWKENYGCKEFSVDYTYGSSSSVYGTPVDRCVVTVKGLYSRRIAQAQQWQNTGSRTPIWTNKKHDSTWEGWTKFTGGGSGTEHTATLETGISGTVKWIVQNGVCYVNINSLNTGATGQNQLICPIPKAKTSIYVAVPLVRGDGSSLLGNLYIIGTDSRLFANITSVADAFASFSYPVADDWVES